MSLVGRRIKLCKVCGSPDVVTYQKNGYTQRRTYCRIHWNEFMLARSKATKPEIVCKVCGSADVVLYNRHGKGRPLAKRNLCKKHWNEKRCEVGKAKRAAARAEREKRKRRKIQPVNIPKGWQKTRHPHLTPPEGMVHLYISRDKQTITIYYKNWVRVQHFDDTFTHFYTRNRIASLLLNIGYKFVNKSKSYLKFEKVAWSTITQWEDAS